MFNNNRVQRNASNSVKKNSKGMWEYMTPEQVSKNPNQEEIIKAQLTQGKKFDIEQVEIVMQGKPIKRYSTTEFL